MWPPPVNHGERMPPMPRLFAVAIDRDKSSQIALKWAVDNLLVKGQTVILIHVKLKQSVPGLPAPPSFPSRCNPLSLRFMFIIVYFSVSPCILEQLKLLRLKRREHNNTL